MIRVIWAIALAAAGYAAVSEWAGVRRPQLFVMDLTDVVAWLLLGTLLAVLVDLVVQVLGRLLDSKAERQLSIAAGMLLGWCAVTAAFVGLFRSADWFRGLAFARAAENAVPLVEAIEAYVAANGRPPEDLKDLVPAWIDAIPRTSLRDYSVYQYECAPERRFPSFLEASSPPPWLLWVHAARDRIYGHLFLYFPEREYGVVVSDWNVEHELVGDWVYVRVE
ncbi:MAG: hypothetical protein AAGB93_18715 [Planctomycetota bacterium]